MFKAISAKALSVTLDTDQNGGKFVIMDKIPINMHVIESLLRNLFNFFFKNSSLPNGT